MVPVWPQGPKDQKALAIPGVFLFQHPVARRAHASPESPTEVGPGSEGNVQTNPLVAKGRSSVRTAGWAPVPPAPSPGRKGQAPDQDEENVSALSPKLQAGRLDRENEN